MLKPEVVFGYVLSYRIWNVFFSAGQARTDILLVHVKYVRKHVRWLMFWPGHGFSDDAWL